MLGIFTKHPSEKLEYWRKYRRENAMRCREQRSQLMVSPTIELSSHFVSHIADHEEVTHLPRV